MRIGISRGGIETHTEKKVLVGSLKVGKRVKRSEVKVCGPSAYKGLQNMGRRDNAPRHKSLFLT